MHLYFAEFRYDIEKQLLYKAGELIPLKRNQAAMLDYFLTDVESIHNKYDILDTIWAEQDVSQQVVFQTISELRGIFGGPAIRTFSRIGYKWNLPVDAKKSSLVTENRESARTSKNTNAQVNDLTKQPQLSRRWFAILILAILSLILLAFLALPLFKSEKHESISLNLLIAKKEDTQTINKVIFREAIAQLENIYLSYLPSDLYPSQAFSSPSLAVQRTSIPVGDWLVWSEHFSSAKGDFLKYGFSRGKINWQGYIYAETLAQLSTSLSNRIKQLEGLGLFSTSLESLDISTLQSMMSKTRHDSDLLLLIAEHFTEIGHHDVALGYLNKLVKSPSSPLSNIYSAQAHLNIANIYKNRGQNIQARHSLDAMQAILLDNPVWSLHFKYVETKAWLAYNETKYQEMHQILADASKVFNLDQKGYSSSRKSKYIDPLLVFRFHILSSILAKKTDNEVAKYSHLNQAQALLLGNKLDESNLAVVYYHFALFARQEQRQRESVIDMYSKQEDDSFLVYLRKILALPYTSDNYWVHESAFELIVNYYIDKKEFEEAERLFALNSHTAKQLSLKAKLLQAQNKHKQAFNLFEKAFDQARLTYDKGTGVEVALQLYQLLSNNRKAQAQYKAYLESNTDKDWLNKRINTMTN